MDFKDKCNEKFYEIAQYSIYRRETKSVGRKKTFKDFSTSIGEVRTLTKRICGLRRAIIAEGSSHDVEKRRGRLANWTPDGKKLEAMVDAFSGQFSQCSLMVKTTKATNRDLTSTFQRVFYFCKNLENGDGSCDENPRRDHKCEEYGKIGKTLATCRYHVEGMDHRVPFQDVCSQRGAEAKA